MFSNKAFWFYWLIVTIILAVYLIMRLDSDDKTVFLPGKTSDGHHQIEMACSACHTDPYGGKEVLQDACVSCHGEELKLADDSHPKSKFTDPRNADRVAKLDARVCITCHVEHKEEITQVMGVTLPEDFCYKCHADVAEERPSHDGMAFTTCASAGCHNFHDNRAIYEDFLEKHLDEPNVLPTAVVPERVDVNDYIEARDYPRQQFPVRPLDVSDIDSAHKSIGDDIKAEWLESAHSQAGVNCLGCHRDPAETTATAWVEKPDYQTCRTCHDLEVDGFLTGKHGMRRAQGLPPMTPAQARIPMQDDAHSQTLACTSCHTAHRFNTQAAAVEACLGCHNDRHSLNYRKSKHYQLWEAGLRKGEPETGVSCATCHLPRTIHKVNSHETVLVQHNQNDNLRPNEKMLRSVCMNCHGLEFSIDALADKASIKENFSTQPSIHIESMDLVRKRSQQSKGQSSNH